MFNHDSFKEGFDSVMQKQALLDGLRTGLGKMVGKALPLNSMADNYGSGSGSGFGAGLMQGMKQNKDFNSAATKFTTNLSGGKLDFNTETGKVDPNYGAIGKDFLGKYWPHITGGLGLVGGAAMLMNNNDNDLQPQQPVQNITLNMPGAQNTLARKPELFQRYTG